MCMSHESSLFQQHAHAPCIQNQSPQPPRPTEQPPPKTLTKPTLEVEDTGKTGGAMPVALQKDDGPADAEGATVRYIGTDVCGAT